MKDPHPGRSQRTGSRLSSAPRSRSGRPASGVFIQVLRGPSPQRRDTGLRGFLRRPDVSVLPSNTFNHSRRGQGLLHFVDSYRQLTRLPTPRPQRFALQALGQSVLALFQQQAQQQQVQLSFACEPAGLTLLADQDMLEQALINLLKNAFDAVQGREHAIIELRASSNDNNHTLLSVRDNGSGIAADLIDSIFIPFFTTKRGGSGIGLSLVKQIVQLNGGRISVVSSATAGTCFTLTFR